MHQILKSRLCRLCTKASSLANVGHNRQWSNFVRWQVPSRSPLKQNLRKHLASSSFYRSLNISNALLLPSENDGSNDKSYFEDPELKKWLKEIHDDFSKHESKEEFEKSEDKTGKDEDLLHSEETNFKVNRGLRDQITSGEIDKEKTKPYVNPWAHYTTQRYENFESSPSTIIYDFTEEMLRREEGLVDEKVEEEEDEVTLKRGKTGVFDVEELVDFMREENARNIAVIQIPPELKYANYMVIVSSQSQRHRDALAELVRVVYKKKKNKKEKPAIVEGKKTDWIAMDLGNIVLHIMKPDTREMYDLEMLWCVGAEYDDKCQKEEMDPMSMYQVPNPLAGLNPPAESSENTLS